MVLVRRRRGERGAAAVEFALIMPIFLMLLFGIIDFGYAINRASIVNNAARDGARVASLSNTTDDMIRAAANATLNGVPDATVALSCLKQDPATGMGTGSCAWADRETGDTAVVTVNYSHKMLTPVGIFLPGGLDLSRTVEMRIEG